MAERVTFLLTEVVGSAEQWDRDEARMARLTSELDRIVRALVAEHRGTQVKPRGEGDSYFLVFDDPVGAVGCAVALQRAVHPLELPFRSACHVGGAEFRNGDWYGTTVNRTARLRAAANGGQALVSAEVADVVRAAAAPSEISLRSLGRHRLKDLDEPIEVFQVCATGLTAEHPPLATLAQSHGLPLPGSSFVGRASELDAIVAALREDRLVAVKGAPGMGTTRLALEAAGAWWEADGRPLHPLVASDGEVIGARVTDAHEELRGPAVVSGNLARDLDGAVVVRVPALDALDAEYLLQDRLPPDVTVPPGLIEHCSGFPLAIELLARRAASMGADVLADRLASDPLAVLGGNRHAAPPRHSSIRATFEAAFDELEEQDRTLPLVAAFLEKVARR